MLQLLSVAELQILKHPIFEKSQHWSTKLMLTKVALAKNMMSQLSKTVPDVILSFREQFKVASKNM